LPRSIRSNDPPRVHPIVVSDSGPLIALAGCGHLELLTAVFEAIHVPQAVRNETTRDHLRPGAAAIAVFLQAHARVHPDRHDAIYAAAASHLDEGEAQALSLAHALGCGVLMDERRGRQEAIRQGMKPVGVLGVLLQAKRIGRIERIAPVTARMLNNGYRIAQELIDATLKLAGEAG
jgi:predicted nucleic acid-binding protein